MAVRAYSPRSIADIPVFRAADLKGAPGGGSWKYDNLVGVLAEVSEEAAWGALSFAAEIIADAQDQSEPAAWVAGARSVFYPPDLSDRGIDLSALVVVRAGGESDSLTAAEWLLRSGSIGLVILDADGQWSVSDACLGRLQKLAEKSRCAVVFLTRKKRSDPSLGSRISLRGCVTRAGTAGFHIDIHTVKDKRSNASARMSRQYNGPSGMH